MKSRVNVRSQTNDNITVVLCVVVSLLVCDKMKTECVEVGKTYCLCRLLQALVYSNWVPASVRKKKVSSCCRRA